jgi:chromate transporter
MGLLIGWLFFQAKAKAVPSRPSRVNPNIRSGWLARGALLLVAVGFMMLPLLAWWQREIWWEMIAGFYQAGLLVFGGGHVVLPLLEAQTVGRGWMDADSFLAGYGAAQALPGPLFTLAAYLGTVINPAGWGWIGGVVALIAILIPSMLLVVGTLPHWDRLRGMPGAQAALMGANAAVVGILLAAFYQPVFVSGVTSLTALAMAIAGFIALQYWKLPAWALVGLCGLLGAWLL